MNKVITVVIVNKMDVPVEFLDIRITLQPKEAKACFFPGKVPLSVKDAVKIGMISIVSKK